MPFRTFCDNKGCLKEMTPLIDKKTKAVYCSECEDEVSSVDVFMKNQLISMGQIRRNNERKGSYSVECHFCEKKGTPKLGNNREIVCGFCSEDITAKLSGPFVELLRSVLKK